MGSAAQNAQAMYQKVTDTGRLDMLAFAFSEGSPQAKRHFAAQLMQQLQQSFPGYTFELALGDTNDVSVGVTEGLPLEEVARIDAIVRNVAATMNVDITGETVRSTKNRLDEPPISHGISVADIERYRNLDDQ